MKHILILMLNFVLPFLAYAQIPETLQAIQMNKEGKVDEAFALLSKVKNSSAFKKDTLGMQTLGAMYLRGSGTIKDAEEGIMWTKMATEKGSKKARTVLGVMYYLGDGVKKDYKQAAEYLLPSAEAGEEIAMLFLGDMYSSGGKGISRNEKECVKWFRTAANKGNTEGLYQMGRMFETGLMGLNVDKSEAIKLYEKAANKSEERSICAMGRCNLKGIGVKTDEDKAFEWFNKAPEFAECQYYIGIMYRDGWGETQPDTLQAKKWLKKAAKQSNEAAQTALDDMDPNKVKEKKVTETEKLQQDLNTLIQSLGAKKNNGNGSTNNSQNMGGGNNGSSMDNGNESMSLEEVVAKIKSENTSYMSTIAEEGKVEKGGEYNFRLTSMYQYQVFLVLPYTPQGYTPKISMNHKTESGSYDYRFDSDWGDVKKIGGLSVISMTFQPKIEGGHSDFVGKVNCDAYLIIIQK